MRKKNNVFAHFPCPDGEKKVRGRRSDNFEATTCAQWALPTVHCEGFYRQNLRNTSEQIPKPILTLHLELDWQIVLYDIRTIPY